MPAVKRARAHTRNNWFASRVLLIEQITACVCELAARAHIIVMVSIVQCSTYAQHIHFTHANTTSARKVNACTRVITFTFTQQFAQTGLHIVCNTTITSALHVHARVRACV
jgi:hypothetical protein